MKMTIHYQKITKIPIRSKMLGLPHAHQLKNRDQMSFRSNKLKNS